MRILFENQTGAETRLFVRGARQLGWVLPRGILKWYNSEGTSGASITLVDNFTKEEVFSGTISASDGGNSGEINIPYDYTVEISGITGSPIIKVGMDGDAGDKGTVV